MSDPADVYVVSDLHLCGGWSPQHQRYARLEVFFYDREFDRWLERVLAEQAARQRPALLLLNGDVFDFLALNRIPSEEEAAQRGLRISRAERKFGLSSSEKKSAWKMEQILAGHRPFFVALARFLSYGHRLIILRGNHDAELYWPLVQDIIASGIMRVAAEEHYTEEPEELRSRIGFRQWFYYEPGRLYVEHGNQYEESNSFRYGLCPELPSRYTVDHEVGIDYPLGSLFVQYLYNKLKTVDPYGAYFVSVDQYVRLLASSNFLDMARVMFLHLPFFFRAIKGLRLFEQSSLGHEGMLHRARRRRLGRREELSEKVDELDSLVVAPVGKTKYAFLMEILKPVFKAIFTTAGLTLVAILAWFLLFQIIQQEDWLAAGTFGRASLLAILAVLTFVGLFLLFSQVNRRLASRGDPMVEQLADSAEKIGDILDVPVVCMGHTHQADYRILREGKTVYANSGTWIRAPGPWDQIKARARQFTFLRIQETRVEVLRWDDPNRIWEPVPLLEGYHPSALEKLLPETPQETPDTERS